MKIKFRFENIRAWQEARALNHQVYQLTRKLPGHELYGMTSQIRRASVSVSSNIAEGSGRNSDKDFAHFLEQSYGSLMETASLFYLALDEGCVAEAELDPVFDKMDQVAKLTASLNRSLTVGSSKTPFQRARPALAPRPSPLP